MSPQVGAGLTIGHELVTCAGLSWVLEASSIELVPLSERSPAGNSWQVDTTLGYRF